MADRDNLAAEYFQLGLRNDEIVSLLDAGGISISRGHLRRVLNNNNCYNPKLHLKTPTGS